MYLQKYNIAGRDNWFNGHNNQSWSAFNNTLFKNNMRKKYGFENPSQVPEIQTKMYNSNKNKSVEEKERIGKLKARPGELNGMYGTVRRGEDGPFYGKHHSEESKKMLSDIAVGKCIMQDKDGNFYKVEINDERIKSGELFSGMKNCTIVRDSSGNTLKVNLNDEKYLNGEYTHVNKGKLRTIEARSHISSKISKLKWYNDGIKNIRIDYIPDETWKPGRLKFKQKRLTK